MSSLDPETTYLFTSLTSGSSHIIDSTLRLQHILQTRKIPFVAIDIATDDVARRIWVNRSGPARKLPGVVRNGVVLGDWTEIEEWVENGMVTEKLGAGVKVTGYMGAKAEGGAGKGSEEKGAPEKTKVKVMETKKEEPKPVPAPEKPEGMASLAAEAAAKAKELKKQALFPKKKTEDTTSTTRLEDEVKKLDIKDEKKDTEEKKPEVEDKKPEADEKKDTPTEEDKKPEVESEEKKPSTE
jgi:hypothetical protein